MLKHSHNLIDPSKIIPSEIHFFKMFLYNLWQKKKKILLSNDILLSFKQFCLDQSRQNLIEGTSPLYKFIKQIPEIVFFSDYVLIIHRYQPTKCKIYKMGIQGEMIEEISKKKFLDIMDRYVKPDFPRNEEKLRIDFLPFYDYGPAIRDVKAVGKGVEFLNKNMSSQLFQNPEKWNKLLFDFLKIHSFDEHQLLVNNLYNKNTDSFIDDLESLLEDFENFKDDTPYKDILGHMKKYGLEPGWGNSLAAIREKIGLLLDLFKSPDKENLEKFISHIPMISRIAIISPHGWFGQENVLGRPDTGGQVVYILDQARALEKQLTVRIKSYGLSTIPKILIVTRLIPDNQGTSCHIRLEKIYQTQNSFILRVPFIDEKGNVIQQWISRFELWPYLERFAFDVKREIVSEFKGIPDLVIGNYSDGNLVATLLCRQFNVTQCNIAHALEKNKYLFSDLYWFDYEKEYHFSLQLLADLISMNMADFIITSTLQEIIGSKESPGQYESYQFFTMPDYVQVINGVNLFHPKFNIIPPGVDEVIYFPYYEKEKRLKNQTKHLNNIIFKKKDNNITGHLTHPGRYPIFTMARLDRNKNITGLVESFGKNKQLQEKCNLIVIAGSVDPHKATDREEYEEINYMHSLIKEYNLYNKIRWLGMHLSRDDAGEVYRIIADHKGLFVQPGKFEGFGLTVLEAMISGLPAFATQFGGPSEIINHKRDGFVINPTLPELISEPVLEFITNCENKKDYWNSISRAGVKRVKEHFTWEKYSIKVLNLTALYSFWRFTISNIGKKELELYCHLLFQLLYKPGAKALEKLQTKDY